MKRHHLLAAAALLGFAALPRPRAAAQAPTQMGYTTFQFQRNNGVSLNKQPVSETDSRTPQGVAIHIGKEKAALLKGCALTGLRAAFGTKHVSEMKIFVTREPGGTPLAETAVTGAATSAKNFNFSAPVTLDGGEFYVGYSFLLDSPDYLPLLFDRTNDLAAGTVWAYTGGGWSDISASGLGAPILRMLVTGAPDFADLVVKPFATDGYYKAGDGFPLSAQLFNFGTKPVTSITVKARVGDGEEKTYTADGLNIAPGAVHDYTLPGVSASKAGHYDLALSVTAVNGEADAAPADNTESSRVCVYPADMTRKILLENFTGRDCSNCPDGHRDMAAAIAGNEDHYVTVAHHAGYQPDFYSMAEDYAYTWFYNAQGTYAPAFMLNRSTFAQGQTTAVFGPDANNASTAQNFRAAIPAVESAQPFVKVDMENSYDPATRKGKVAVTVNTVNVPGSAPEHRLNVWLTQDKIIGYQNNGGTDYEHNHVFRATLTGTWGEKIDLKEGATLTHAYDYEIPESYFATYWNESEIKPELLNNYKPAALPENMHIVAFVGGASASPTGCGVYNANTIGVTTNGGTAGLRHTAAGESARAFARGGRLLVAGAFGTARVYNTAGRLVSVFTEGAESPRLPAGVYLVRLDGRAAQKVAVK